MDHDTIVAISSATGAGLRGVIRISGTQAFSCIERFWRDSLVPATYKLQRGRLFIEKWHTAVPTTLYLMKAPYSYTREDCIEIHTISSPVLLDAIIEQLVTIGVRPAEPGEFTRRAFLSGRIDLAQAEAVMALIAATNETQRRMAVTGVAGTLSREMAKIQDSLAYLVALMEAHIDFLEEEVPPLAIDEVTRQLRTIEQQLHSFGRHGQEIADRALHVCICGLPNAGKSTLLNAIAGESVALASDLAGTTLDWLEVEVSIEGMTFKLIDTPGLEDQASGLQQKAQQKIPVLLASADIVLFVIDGTKTFAPKNEDILQNLPAVPLLLVRSKADLPAIYDDRELRRQTAIENLLAISSVSGQGLQELRKWLADVGKTQANKEYSLLTARQYRSIRETLALLSNVQEGLHTGVSYEFLVVDLRCALDFLGEIVGKVTTEEILDRVFGQFCIGK